MSRRLRITAALLLTLGCASSRPSATAERFLSNAINLNGGPAAGMTQLRIVIDSWSTAEELATLRTAFQSGGGPALLNALQSLPVRGTIAIPGHLGWDLHFTWQRPEQPGRNVYILTDRWIGFLEASRNARSMDHPFTFAELHLDGNDHGEGKLSVATEIKYNAEKKVLEMENWSIQPIRLTEIRRE